MFKNRKLIKLKVILILGVFAGLIILFYSISRNEHLSYEPSDASTNFNNWKFVVIGDTHSSDLHRNSHIYQKIISQDIVDKDPVLVIHVGDLGWGQHRSLEIGDYRYQPLSGLLNIQEKSDAEIHVALGNHDVKNIEGTTTPNKEINLLDVYRKGLCFGEHYYWGEEGEAFADHYFHNSAVPENFFNEVEVSSGHKPFNQDILNNSFCEEDSTSLKYSFVRGGINFVLTDWALNDNLACHHDHPPSEKEIDWLNNNVCNTDANQTILFVHDPNECLIKRIIDNLNCREKAPLILSGHGHQYTSNTYKGVQFIQVSGMAEMTNASVHQSDYILAEVSKDEVFLKRNYMRVGESTLQSVDIFSFKGDFKKYDNSYLQEVVIKVESGNSMVNIPSNALEDFVKHNEGLRVAWYGRGQWNIVSTSKIPELPYGTGFLVSSKEDLSLKVTGEYKNFDEDKLMKGWNLVGITDYSDAKEFLSSESISSKKVRLISEYTGNGYSTIAYKNGDFYGRNFVLSKEKAYFILVED